jgi:uncharacterized protein (TIGR02147 family)
VDASVFGYLDYRTYLRDYYEQRKRLGRISFRSFAQRAKLGSPNYLKLVIDGERKLTPKMATRFATACGLSGAAHEYFVELVEFTHAKNLEERAARYAGLKRFAQYREARRLDLAQDAYHSKWYLPAIRELVGVAGFQEDPEWIARRLIPAIKAGEVERGIATLVELGLLRRNEKQRLEQCEPVVSTGAEVTQSLHIANYHRVMSEKAMQSIELVPQLQREISALTLTLSADGLTKIKRRIQAFQRELIELSQADTAADQVVQVNFHCFPLSSVDIEKDQP